MANLDLWNSVKETDPSKTKGYKGAGGFVGTAINPTYLIQKATDIWGPMGISWGYEIIEDRFDQGSPILDKEGVLIPGAFLQTHTIKLRLWYPSGEANKPGEIVHYGHTPFVYSNKYGIQTDFEAAKKSLTDALKKCLSMLGFSADIMLGDFEDADYRQGLEEKVRVEKAVDKAQEEQAIESEHKDWLDKHASLLAEAVTLNELETVFKLAFKTLKARKDSAGIKVITKAKDIRKKQLESKDDSAPV